MKTKELTAACMIVAMSIGFVPAAFAEVCYEGCEPEEPEEPEEPQLKGNNGWGNGVDGPNPGTLKGNASQVSTKSNETPAVFDLDKVARFGGR